MYKFESRDSLFEADPDQRFSAPTNDQIFKWWLLAEPQPAYRVCVAKIGAITDDDRFQCQLCTIHNVVKPAVIDIDLRDWTQVWRGYPSTVEVPTRLSQGIDPQKNWTLLCLSEAALTKAGWTKTEIDTFSKWPRGEDLTVFRAFARAVIARFPADQLAEVPGYDHVYRILGTTRADR